VADDRDQVLGIPAVENRERLLHSNPFGVLTEEARANAVKRASPWQGSGPVPCRGNLIQELQRPAFHFRCGPAAEGQQKDPLWVGTAMDQVRKAVGHSLRLAGARAGDDKHRSGIRRLRSGSVLDGEPLLRVEGRQEAVAAGS
jgi:hypothetical protein